MNPAALAPEIDRLVWAVNGRAKNHEVDYAILDDVGMSAAAMDLFNNLVPFVDMLSEQFVLRRYIYRPAWVIRDFVEELVANGFFVRDGDRLVPTERVDVVVEELNQAARNAARHFWVDHRVTIEAAQGPVRRVLEASPERYGLAQAALAGRKPDDLFHRFHYRLAGLRLLRNEAHVEAWKAHDLTADEIETLTAAWAGTEPQTPLILASRLQRRGLVVDGQVTEAGLALREQIEAETNEGVASAFDSIDQRALYAALEALPPETL